MGSSQSRPGSYDVRRCSTCVAVSRPPPPGSLTRHRARPGHRMQCSRTDELPVTGWIAATLEPFESPEQSVGLVPMQYAMLA